MGLVKEKFAMDKSKDKRFRLSLSTSILIGVVLGVVCGIFFGDYCASLQIFGDAFIKLLQMTILPYIIVSLILGIGGLTYDQAKLLAVKAGALLLLFWAISFAIVLLIPLSFPEWKSAAFFSTSLVEPPKRVDFLNLYIPSNPFSSLANNVVPAVVLFSILLGVALIGVKEKDAVIQGLSAAAAALIKMTNLVVNLTPFGVFAISAAAAGTMSIEEFGRLQVYLVSFNVAALFLTFWILPKLLTPMTPFKYKDIVGFSRDALATAFATGNLFVVLAVLTENCKTLFRQYDLTREKTESYVDVIVPVSFNFPTTGKLLMLSFILFAGWFSGHSLSLAQYPTFVFSGLLSFFGGIDVAMPFMLDLMQLPSDLYQLYVVTGILNGRFATLLAAMNLIVFTILGACLLTGAFSLNKKKLLNYLVVTLLLTGAFIGGTRVYFSHFVKNIYTKDKVLVEMNLSRNPAKAKVHKSLPPPLPPHDPGKSHMDEIHRRGFIRVGYLKDQLPYAFKNTKGQLVGFDIDMAYELARTLDVSLEFVLLKRDKTAVERLNAGYCDIIMSGIRATPKRAEVITFSEPYMDETMAFVVKDYRRDEFNSWEAIEKIDAPKIGIGGNIPYYISKLRDYLPKAEIVILNSPREFFKNKGKDLDALLFTAEAGSAWTLLYPDFTVVVPHPDIIAVPLAYPLAYGNQEMADYMNSWIELKKKDNTIENLYNYWILGQGATKKEPRWSVIRNVLHWVD